MITNKEILNRILKGEELTLLESYDEAWLSYGDKNMRVKIDYFSARKMILAQIVELDSGCEELSHYNYRVCINWYLDDILYINLYK